MVCCKRLLIIFTIFLVLIGFSSFSWCAEVENVSYESIYGFSGINNNSNFFTSGNLTVGYFLMEKGFIYHITNNGSYTRGLAISPSVPEFNGIYQYLYRLEVDGTFDYMPSNSDYLYFDFTQGTQGAIIVTRERVGSMDTVVQELANVVSPNQLWNVLNDSIPYVLIVVVVGFGFYIIFKLIKKFSKGKSANI